MEDCDMMHASEAGAAAFIRANLPLTEVAGTGVRLHLAGPRSGLARLVPAGGTPYWAYAWPGGVALAAHIAAHPDLVSGRAVYDFGAGSGLVAIAALRAGSLAAYAWDTDPLAKVAARVNALANGEDLIAMADDPTSSMPSADDAHPFLILAGDVFYDAATATRMVTAFDMQPGATILVGDIGRTHLPRNRLEPLASYPVRDVGDPASASQHDGWVYRWRHT